MDDLKKGQRLHKVLAQAGISSRRKAETLIAEGRVKVDGKIVTEMGMVVDPHKQDIRFDDEKIRMERPAYYLVYKPKDVLCTTADGWGRKTIIDMLGDRVHARLFSVGRLELESEGLVLLTNDGDFAQRCLHPRRGLDRTYYVKVRGAVLPEVLDKARAGVWLSDGKTAPMEVSTQRIGRDVSTFRCTLVERQHRELRRLWAKLGHPVERMVLVSIGSVGTQELKKGSWRQLTDEEVRALRDGLPRKIRAGKMARGSKSMPRDESEGDVPPAPTSDWGDDDVVDSRPRAPRTSSRPSGGGTGPRRSSPRTDSRAPTSGTRSPRPARGFGDDRSDRGPGRGRDVGSDRGPSHRPGRDPGYNAGPPTPRVPGRAMDRSPSRSPSRGPGAGLRRGPSRGDDRGRGSDAPPMRGAPARGFSSRPAPRGEGRPTRSGPGARPAPRGEGRPTRSAPSARPARGGSARGASRPRRGEGR